MSIHWWEQDGCDVDGGDEDEESVSSDEDEANPSPRRAGIELIELLIFLRLTGVISAKMLCHICFWAAKAGATGPVSEFAKAPGAQTGKYQRHMDRLLGFKQAKQKQAVLRVPTWAVHSGERVLTDIRVVPPHEALDEETIQHPENHALLREAIAKETLPHSYCQHVLVRQFGPVFSHCGLY